MIHNRLLPLEFYGKAEEIFDSAFASKFCCLIPSKESRFKVYRLIFKQTPIIYFEEEGEFMGLIVYSTATTPKMLTRKDICSAIGCWRGLFASMLFTMLEHKPAKDTLKLGFIAVDSEQRGKGIGNRLLSYAEGMASQGGYTKMALEVVSSNPDAKRLYEKIGFKESEVMKIGFLRRLLKWDFDTVYGMIKELIPRKDRE